MTFEPREADWHQPYPALDVNAWHKSTSVGMADVTLESSRWHWQVIFWDNDKSPEGGTESHLTDAMAVAEVRIQDA